MQNLNAPEEGKIYISEADPTLKILVESVHTIPADDKNAAGFLVEGCAPDDEDGIGFEFLDNEWSEHRFMLSQHP